MLKILTNNRAFFIIFLVWVMALAILQIFFTQTELIFWVNQNHSISLDYFFKYITLLGEDGLWVIILLFYFFKLFVEKKPVKNAILLFVMIWLVKVLVSITLKNIFSQPRPIEVYLNKGKVIHLIDGLEIYHWNSFPSGHSITAFALACFGILVIKKEDWTVLGLFLAFLVGYSRVYLFQHFPRDVFAGSLLGVGVVLAVATFTKQGKSL